jgi:hypothetical protein
VVGEAAPVALGRERQHALYAIAIRFNNDLFLTVLHGGAIYRVPSELMEHAGSDARSPALEAVFERVHPPTTFEETVERLGTAIRLGVLPPGDVLKCALALARNEGEARRVLLARLPTLEHAKLGGHTGGNLLLSMMERYSGDFLDAIDAGPIALVLEGEVGIGKTALWNEGLAAALGRLFRVLVCRPSESEAQLAYAALGDLLADVPEAALSELAEPQRRALEVALLRREPEGEQPLPRAVALGTLAVLRAFARESPVLVGIDDVQWLDPPSRSALAFVARRLMDERIGLLVARRLDGASAVPLDLEPALPEGRVRRVRVKPLEPPDLDRLLAIRLEAELPRRALTRLHRTAGGNPFFALEIGRALLQRGGRPEHSDELPIPASLQELVSDRLAVLPDDEPRILLARLDRLPGRVQRRAVRDPLRPPRHGPVGLLRAGATRIPQR